MSNTVVRHPFHLTFLSAIAGIGFRILHAVFRTILHGIAFLVLRTLVLTVLLLIFAVGILRLISLLISVIRHFRYLLMHFNSSYAFSMATEDFFIPES